MGTAIYIALGKKIQDADSMINGKTLSKRTMLGIFVAMLWGMPAWAGLSGSTMSWQYYAFGGPLVPPYTLGQYSGTFIVNGGVGGTCIDGNPYVYFNIVADDTSITFDYSVMTLSSDSYAASVLSLAPTIHNGIAINMVSGPALAAVRIDPASNMVGFDSRRLSFTSSQIEVDWQNLFFYPDTVVKLDISTVPEPSAFALTGLGAAAVMIWRRRK